MTPVEALEAKFTPARQRSGEERLALLLQIFEGLGRHLDRDPWTSGVGWTGDGGTLALAFLADMLGLERKIQVGRYWPANAAIASGSGGMQAQGEHHHWLDLRVDGTGWWRIDPTAEVREERRLQRAEGGAYEVRPDLADWLNPAVETRLEVGRDALFVAAVQAALRRELPGLDVLVLDHLSASEWGNPGELGIA